MDGTWKDGGAHSIILGTSLGATDRERAKATTGDRFMRPFGAEGGE